MVSRWLFCRRGLVLRLRGWPLASTWLLGRWGGGGVGDLLGGGGSGVGDLLGGGGCGVGDLLGDGVDAASPSNTLSSYRAL